MFILNSFREESSSFILQRTRILCSLVCSLLCLVHKMLNVSEYFLFDRSCKNYDYETKRYQHNKNCTFNENWPSQTGLSLTKRC